MKFNALIPELTVKDLARSLPFYFGLGFRVEYERPDFAFLSYGEAQLMLEQVNGHWQTGPLERPFGRGINFQIRVEDVAALAQGRKLFREVQDAWYEVRDGRHGQREFLIQDPDGYLLRFYEILETPPCST